MTRQIIILLFILSTFTTKIIHAMEYDFTLKNHPFAIVNGIKHYMYPDPSDDKFVSDSTFYAQAFMHCLHVNLKWRKQDGASSYTMHKYTESLLETLYRFLQQIKQRQHIRDKYYPQMKAIEWKIGTTTYNNITVPTTNNLMRLGLADPLSCNYQPFPSGNRRPYKYNPELYAKAFKDRLVLELYHLKYTKKSSESHLKMCEKNLLRHMQEQKNKIIQQQQTKITKEQISFVLIDGTQYIIKQKKSDCIRKIVSVVRDAVTAHVVEDSLRTKYYPQTRAIEWKK